MFFTMAETDKNKIVKKCEWYLPFQFSSLFIQVLFYTAVEATQLGQYSPITQCSYSHIRQKAQMTVYLCISRVALSPAASTPSLPLGGDC